jgi:mannose-6-phosphate isomerase-like protein (cupin superfamily)
MKKINVAEKFAKFSEQWLPKIIGEINDTYVKAVKLKGEFVWHHHENEDEMFFVTKGTLRMKLRVSGFALANPEREKDHEEIIRTGEFIIIPRGVEHMPVADGEVHVLLFEPKSTLNTGNVVNEWTVAQLERI